MGKCALQQALEGNFPVCPVCHTFSVCQKAELVARVLHWRQISVQLIAVSGTEEHRMGIVLCHCSYGNKTQVREKNNPFNHQTNVIVAHPIIIRNSANDCLFLGYSDSNCSGYSISSFLDYAFNKKHEIPPEFIFGFYEEKNSDGNYEFRKNEKFIAGEKVSDEFFNSINENLGYFSEISKRFAKFVHGEISEAKMDEFLNQIFTLFQTYSMSDKIELVKKMKKQADMYRSKLNMLEQDRAE